MRNIGLKIYLPLLCWAFAHPAVFAQSEPVPANGATARDVTTEFSSELLRACKKIDQSVSPARIVAISACTVNYPARFRVDGVEVQGAIPPLLLAVPNVGGKMFVEMSSAFSQLGFSVSWDGATQTVTATRNDFSVKMTLGSHVILNTRSRSAESSGLSRLHPLLTSRRADWLVERRALNYRCDQHHEPTLGTYAATIPSYANPATSGII